MGRGTAHKADTILYGLTPGRGVGVQAFIESLELEEQQLLVLNGLATAVDTTENGDKISLVDFKHQSNGQWYAYSLPWLKKVLLELEKLGLVASDDGERAVMTPCWSMTARGEEVVREKQMVLNNPN